MVIPAEAVDAAHERVRHLDIDSSDIEAILEAAAPHMLNLAKCEALDANLEIQRLREELVELAKEFDTAEGGTLAYTATIEGRYAMRKNAHDQLLHIVAGIGRHTP